MVMYLRRYLFVFLEHDNCILMYTYNIPVLSWHGELSHIMSLIESKCKNACKSTASKHRLFTRVTKYKTKEM